jgi:anti-sigma factor RsiW
MPHLSDEDRENLTAYLDGELDEDTARALETRLNLDPEARAEADALQQAWNLLDYLPRTETSSSFTHRTLERLALEPRKTGLVPLRRLPGWAVGLGWAAAILLAAGAGLAASGWLWPSSKDAVETEEQMVRHLRVLEKYRLYEPIEDLEFLRALDDPDLFGEDSGS